jgi:hypothetical protein
MGTLKVGDKGNRRDIPLTAKGKKILVEMQAGYGKKKGDDVFYASANKGKITGVYSRAYLAEKRLAKRKRLAKKYK